MPGGHGGQAGDRLGAGVALPQGEGGRFGHGVVIVVGSPSRPSTGPARPAATSAARRRTAGSGSAEGRGELVVGQGPIRARAPTAVARTAGLGSPRWRRARSGSAPNPDIAAPAPAVVRRRPGRSSAPPRRVGGTRPGGRVRELRCRAHGGGRLGDPVGLRGAEEQFLRASRTEVICLYTGPITRVQGGPFVSHMVIFQSPGGSPGYNQVESLDEAVAFVEQLRNERNVSSARDVRAGGDQVRAPAVLQGRAAGAHRRVPPRWRRRSPWLLPWRLPPGPCRAGPGSPSGHTTPAPEAPAPEAPPGQAQPGTEASTFGAFSAAPPADSARARGGHTTPAEPAAGASAEPLRASRPVRALIRVPGAMVAGGRSPRHAAARLKDHPPSVPCSPRPECESRRRGRRSARRARQVRGCAARPAGALRPPRRCSGSPPGAPRCRAWRARAGWWSEPGPMPAPAPGRDRGGRARRVASMSTGESRPATRPTVRWPLRNRLGDVSAAARSATSPRGAELTTMAGWGIGRRPNSATPKAAAGNDQQESDEQC